MNDQKSTARAPDVSPGAPDRLLRFGGAAFILSGVLFLSKYVLELVAGPPPSSGAEILAWVDEGRLALSLVNELTFFAALALVPSLIALHRGLQDVAPVEAATGCAVMALTIPVFLMLVILHGRLVYPIHGIPGTTPAAAELLVATLAGGQHTTNLLFAVATVALSLALRRSDTGARLAALGFATALFDLAGAYANAIGPVLGFVCQAFFCAWFIALGATLSRAERWVLRR